MATPHLYKALKFSLGFVKTQNRRAFPLDTGEEKQTTVSHTTPCSAHRVPTLPMGLSPPALHIHPEHRGASNTDKQTDLSGKTQVATHAGHTCSTAIYKWLGEAVHGTGKLHLHACSQVLYKDIIKDDTQLTYKCDLCCSEGRLSCSTAVLSPSLFFFISFFVRQGFTMHSWLAWSLLCRRGRLELAETHLPLPPECLD